jgi:lipopolysaccharide assembly protein A
MIRTLRLVFLGLLGLALIAVAVANRSPVEVRLLPDDLAALTGLTWAVELPLFLVIFAAIIVGVLVGFVWEWFREAGIRGKASTTSREVSRLERELAVLQDQKGTAPKDEVLALLDAPKAR